MPIALEVTLSVLGLWMGIGLFVLVLRHGPGRDTYEELEVFLSVSPIALVYWPMQWASDYRARRVQAEYDRINNLNRDVMDVLEMIEWKPRVLTPVELLQEELELERVYE